MAGTLRSAPHPQDSSLILRRGPSWAPAV